MKIKKTENLTNCNCGKPHLSKIKNIIIGKKAVEQLPDELKKMCAKKVFVLADINTYPIAGKRITEFLVNNDISYSEYIFREERLEPDEKAVGSAVMHYDASCDVIVAIGSGVINDIGKILANIADVPYIIVATAPSMDGYASASSSMAMDGVKVTLSSKCPEIIIGDIDILKTAPDKMLKSGLGDMLAKYISICEWRISHEITGEYYCETIAQLVREALHKCITNVDGLLKREDEALKAVFEGLVICGEAMSFAGLSRPASGVEHYLSHIWDMRGLEFGTPVDFHGIQCAVGTLVASKLYEQIKAITPDLAKAMAYAGSFDNKKWNGALREFLGKGAEAMIALEEKEQKYNIDKHKERIKIIAEKWDRILDIIDEEVPESAEIEKLLDKIHAPKTLEDIGLESSLLPMTFKASKDIRDKYVLSRLAWDLGIIEELDYSI